jgi:hypothetical protein
MIETTESGLLHMHRVVNIYVLEYKQERRGEGMKRIKNGMKKIKIRNKRVYMYHQNGV